MKLMIAAGIFHPESGGPATYLYEILPPLQAKGWSARLLTYGDAPVDAYPYPVTRIPRRFLPIRWLHYATVARQEASRADLIYAHTIDLPVPYTSKPSLIKIVGDQAWERCIRRGWIPATTDIDHFQTMSASRVVRTQQASRNRQMQAFQGVIVPSEYLKQMVMGWGVPAEKIHVIYNALPPMPDTLPATQAEARRILGWDAMPTILTAARLEPWKGVAELITVLRDLPDIRLVVAGDGVEMPRLRELAQGLGDRVQLLGQVPRQQLYTMMRASDYFALYSGYEGLSHTLLEALRAGTPLIASDKGGNPEVVTHDVNGLLVPYGDLSALKETIQRAFDGDTRARLAQQSNHRLERFTLSHMVDQTDSILRSYLP